MPNHTGPIVALDLQQAAALLADVVSDEDVSPADRAALAALIASHLLLFEQVPLNRTPPSDPVPLKKTHIRLRATLWGLIQDLLLLWYAETGAYRAIRAVFSRLMADFLDRIRNLISLLDETELQVYRLIVGFAAADCSRQALDSAAELGTVQDIYDRAASLTGMSPLEVDQAIRMLAMRKAISKSSPAAGVETYQPFLMVYCVYRPA